MGIGVSGSQNGSGWGVYGYAPSGIGVYGNSDSGTGVQGSVSSGGYGVYGDSSTGTAVYGTTDSGTGVEGDAGSGTGVRGASTGGYGVYGTSPGNYAVVGVTTSGNGVYGQVSTAPQAGIVGRQTDASGNWAIYGFGNIGATGTKSAVVPINDGAEHVTLYCVESPECSFEDFGSAQLSGGSTNVGIDPEFAADHRHRQLPRIPPGRRRVQGFVRRSEDSDKIHGARTRRGHEQRRFCLSHRGAEEGRVRGPD